MLTGNPTQSQSNLTILWRGCYQLSMTLRLLLPSVPDELPGDYRS
jgi:hypothetical protein